MKRKKTDGGLNSGKDEAKERNDYFGGLESTSSIDGREVSLTKKLRPFFSESALHYYRGVVEVINLIVLLDHNFPGLPKITKEEKAKLELCLEDFDSCAVAEYDHFSRNGIGPLEHDVKSVEVYLRERFKEMGLEHLSEFIHFPMTSEDANNLAWRIMFRNAINSVWLPELLRVCDGLAYFSKSFADLPVIGITHGMTATPTTFGKRFAYFLERITNTIDQMSTLRFSGKYSGPTGNHNAVSVAFPDHDFEKYAKYLVEYFGFTYEYCENQRNSQLDIVRLLNEVNIINNIAVDLCEHVRHSVMMGWLYLKGQESHVGSSVMPHKINPWFFEVAQGYLEQSIALINASGPGLIQSVFERDLTDHPWERAYGEMVGKSLIGLSYIANGMNSLHVSLEDARRSLEKSPEVLAEAIQIVGRTVGIKDVYMKIKSATRDKKVTLDDIHKIIKDLFPETSTEYKILMALTPINYIGKAPSIALRVVERYEANKPIYQHGILHEMTGIHAVLFDFDSTLHFGDKQELIARLSAIDARLGLGFSPAEIEVFGNRSDYKEMRKLMVDAFNKKSPTTPITEKEFEDVNDSISGTLDHHFELAPGALELLQYLKDNGYLIGLVTTRGVKSLSRLLPHHNIKDFFDVVVGRDQCKERKPHPQPIATALKQLGVSPSRAIYIGDKQVDDVIAGSALGMKTILVTEEPLDEFGAQPNHYCKKMEEVGLLLSVLAI